MAEKKKRTAKAKAKSAAAKAPVEMRTPEHGRGALRVGNPGNRGGGRKSNEWREKMAALGDDPRVLVYLRQCLRGKHGPKAFVQAYKYVTEQSHGKAVQPVNVGGELTQELTVRIVEE